MPRASAHTGARLSLINPFKADAGTRGCARGRGAQDRWPVAASTNSLQGSSVGGILPSSLSCSARARSSCTHTCRIHVLLSRQAETRLDKAGGQSVACSGQAITAMQVKTRMKHVEDGSRRRPHPRVRRVLSYTAVCRNTATSGGARPDKQRKSSQESKP